MYKERDRVKSKMDSWRNNLQNINFIRIQRNLNYRLLWCL